MKLESVEVVAVRRTTVPPENAARQTVPQFIPGGDDIMVPEPLPKRLMVSWFTSNRATQVFCPEMTTLPAALQSPPHPMRLELEDGMAVSATEVPRVKDAVQAVPQTN